MSEKKEKLIKHLEDQLSNFENDCRKGLREYRERVEKNGRK